MTYNDDKGIKERPSFCYLDLFVLIVILLIGWVYTFKIEQFLDIALADESAYLFRGISIPSKFPNAQASPFYSLWYYLLSFVWHDSINLYYFNIKAMIVLPPLMFFLALRGYKASLPISTVFSLIFLYSFGNFPKVTMISHFAVFILLLGLFVSSFFRDRKVQVCILLITALLASYIRPEYFVSFILLSLVLIFLFIYSFRSDRSLNSFIIAGTTLFLCLIFIYLLGLPMKTGERNMVAFGQHYALNWVARHNDNRNPWTNWVPIVKADFGDVKSLPEALLKNPYAVVRHIFHNLRNFPYSFMKVFFPVYPIPPPPTLLVIIFGVLLIVSLGLLHFYRQGSKTLIKKLLQKGKQQWFFILLVLILLLPVIITTVLIAPRSHYLYIWGVIMAFGFIVLLFQEIDLNQKYSRYETIMLLLVFPLLLTRPITIYSSLEVTSLPNLRVIEFLRALDVQVPVNLLDAEGGYGVYLGSNYWNESNPFTYGIAPFEKDAPFTTFLANKSINMIVLSKKVSGHPRFKYDQQWHSFLNDPEDSGFIHLDMPGAKGRSLLIRKEIVGSKLN